MSGTRWFFSFFLALLFHVGVVAGLFFWHPSLKRPIIYSPSFSVALYAQVPREARPARVKEVAKPRPPPKPKAQLLPKPKPVPPPPKVEKRVWKVKKKAVKKAKKSRATQKVKKTAKKGKKRVTKASGARRRGVSKKAAAAREKALLAKALAQVSKEVSLGGGWNRQGGYRAAV